MKLKKCIDAKSINRIVCPFLIMYSAFFIGGFSMTFNNDILNSISVSNDEYFSLTEDKLGKYEDSLFELKRFDTILIKAPSYIDITKREILPVLYISQSDDIREWHVQEYRNLIVVAYNISNDNLIAKTARKDEKKIKYPPKDERNGPPSDTISTASYGTGCEIINIKKPLNIPWQPSQYRITLICFDWVSNTVDVVLQEGNSHPIKGLIRPQSNDITIGAILSSKKDFEKGDVIFTIPERCTTNPEDFTIQGKFIVPVNDYTISEFDKKKAVVIPVWFMIVEKNIDQGSAILAKWFITAEISDKNSEQMVAEGTFSFTLPELLPVITQTPLVPNDYCCYIVINGNVFGPEKCSITE